MNRDDKTVKQQQREAFAELVQENKDILFGKFTATLTQDVKHKKWEDIRTCLVSRGALQYANKTPKELSQIYGDMKRRALERVRKRRTTGEGKVIFTQV
jgi:hypothetical protein